MRVQVRLAGPLGARHGPHHDVTLPDGATVQDALALFDGLPPVRVARSGELIAADAALRDGDAIALVMPVAGGAPAPG